MAGTEPGFRRSGVAAAAVALAAMNASPVFAQDEPNPGQPSDRERPAWRLASSISLRQTLTNNVRQERDGRMDAVTEISPRIRLTSQSGPVQGSLDYSVSGLLYARTSDENTLQHTLAASGRGELVNRRLFVDVDAQVLRVSRNALAVSQVDEALLAEDQTTTANLRVSPFVTGALGSWADYELRLGLNATRTEDSPADSYGNSALLRLASPGSAARRLGWNLEISHEANRFLQGSRTKNDRIVATLLYGFAPEWRLSTRVGREFNDVLTLQRQAYDTWGLGLRWMPSPRTSLEVNADDRYFGRSHSLRFEHRLARMVISFTDSRDVSGNAGRDANSGELRTVYDLLNDLLAVAVPDPVARSAAVDAYLQGNGLTRASLAGGVFLTTGVSLQRRQQATMAYTGVRSTLLVSAHRADTRGLNPSQAVIPGLPAGASARQQGLSMSVSHRLSPQSALTLQAGIERNESPQTAGANAVTTARNLTGSWTLQMPQRAAFSLSARRVLNDSAPFKLNETALVANLVKGF